jgi:ABC-type lipoprotein release transport system permease subunit
MLPIALRGALHYRREGWGVIVQIAIGIALFVVALSFVGTISANAKRLLFGTIGATWLIAPETRDDALVLDDTALKQFADVTGARDVRLRVEVAANASNPTVGADRPESASVSLVGVDLDTEPELAENFGVNADALNKRNIVLHEQVAEQLGVGIGDDVTVALGVTEETFQVGAVVLPRNPNFLLSSWVLVDRTALAEGLYGDPDRITTLLVDASVDAAADIQAGLVGLGTPVTVSEWSDTTWSALMLGPQIWGVLLVAVFTFTFIVICIGLTSLVYSAMLARVRDFAVLKTVGASAGSLRRMYLAEVVVQYVIGFVIGVLCALAATAVVNAIGISSTSDTFAFAVGSTTLELLPTWWAILMPFGIGIVLILTVLWFPIRAVCAHPVLDLLELR